MYKRACVEWKNRKGDGGFYKSIYTEYFVIRNLNGNDLAIIEADTFDDPDGLTTM